MRLRSKAGGELQRCVNERGRPLSTKYLIRSASRKKTIHSQDFLAEDCPQVWMANDGR